MSRVVKVRLLGGPGALDDLISFLSSRLTVENVSAPYLNRRDSGVRRYLDIDLDGTSTSRTDIRR